MKKLVFLAIVSVTLFGCKKPATYKNEIKEDVAYLANDKLEGRQTGTEGEKIAADYLVNRFQNIGLEPKGSDGYIQSYSFKPKTDPHKEVEFTTNADSTITGRNVIGYINNNAKTTIVIGAHYDHLGYGEEGSLADSAGQIHNGADDNASGVAGLLMLANKDLDLYC